MASNCFCLRFPHRRQQQLFWLVACFTSRDVVFAYRSYKDNWLLVALANVLSQLYHWLLESSRVKWRLNSRMQGHKFTYHWIIKLILLSVLVTNLHVVAFYDRAAFYSCYATRHKLRRYSSTGCWNSLPLEFQLRKVESLSQWNVDPSGYLSYHSRLGIHGKQLFRFFIILLLLG